VTPGHPISAAAEPGDGLRRFARQLALPDFGPEGQAKLRRATVLCLGAGGLGSPVLMYLAAAGVGRIRIVDDDRVDLTNLHRQLLYTDADIGKPKAAAAAERVRQFYPDIEAEAHAVRFTAANALTLAGGCDVIVDGSDNFATRYLSNDTAVLLGIPNVYGSIYRWEGQASVFAPSLGGPCYRCLFPQPPPPGTVPSCVEGGVLGVLPGIIGLIQAAEAIKLLTKTGEPLIGRMLHVDTHCMKFRELRLRRDPACPVCGENPSITVPRDETFACAVEAAPSITHAELHALLAEPPPELCVLDVREAWEHRLSPWPPATHAIPMEQLQSRLGEIPAAGEIVVVCSIGERSAETVSLLRARGWAQVRHLAGGLRDWEPLRH
jgi:molybdopterin/thiamine biosynthesis adenylyltransferase/rhodanese-related sulfurtransferase